MMAARSKIFTSKSSNCSIINLHSGLPKTHHHTSNVNSQSPFSQYKVTAEQKLEYITRFTLLLMPLQYTD